MPTNLTKSFNRITRNHFSPTYAKLYLEQRRQEREQMMTERMSANVWERSNDHH